jgi:hypothetical protein
MKNKIQHQKTKRTKKFKIIVSTIAVLSIGGMLASNDEATEATETPAIVEETQEIQTPVMEETEQQESDFIVSEEKLGEAYSALKEASGYWSKDGKISSSDVREMQEWVISWLSQEFDMTDEEIRHIQFEVNKYIRVNIG